MYIIDKKFIMNFFIPHDILFLIFKSTLYHMQCQLKIASKEYNGLLNSSNFLQLQLQHYQNKEWNFYLILDSPYEINEIRNATCSNYFHSSIDMQWNLLVSNKDLINIPKKNEYYLVGISSWYLFKYLIYEEILLNKQIQ